MPKYLRFFLKQNCRIILRVFGHMKGGNKSFFIILFRLCLAKTHFPSNQNCQNRSKGVFAKHPLKHKHPLKPKKPLAKVL